MNKVWILTYLCQFLSIVAGTPSELLVDTSSGPVSGIYNDTAQTVRAFLGIPYAEAPIGELRFSPPLWKQYSNKTLDASRFSPVCPGIFEYTQDKESIWVVLPYSPWSHHHTSEECLTINIWTASQNTLSKRKNFMKETPASPVLLFIPGGGFYEGGSGLDWYDGSKIVENNDDIIVVTFNYRQTVFGYPNAPEIPDGLQNVGLLDQRLAVEWVYKNIKKFGGDPDRILLWGESAGSISVDMYSYAYYENPLVKGFAMNSGEAGLVFSGDYSHSNWNSLSRSLGCTGVSTLTCMRKVPFEKIINGLYANRTILYGFLPIPDNKTFYSNQTDRALKGKIAKLPVLIGNNEREMAADYDLNATSVDVATIIRQSKLAFGCRALKAASQRLSAGVPTWRYLYHGNFTNLSPTPWLGAYHASELPMIFGTWFKSPLHATGLEKEILLSKYMQGAWVEFAKSPNQGLLEYGWPKWSRKEPTLVNLAVNNSAIPVFTGTEDVDDLC